VKKPRRTVAQARQVVRTLTMADAKPREVLICDRDAKWSATVRDRLCEAAVRAVQTPYQALNANAYAERFVRSIKEECLDRMILLGERPFRSAVTESLRTTTGRGIIKVSTTP
jgi:putative transposase